ncbi:MAG: PAS domain S-box protein, partial [Candidatus Cloacimonetes bacterium]|nr:PAS domain S-box protein [Candidatus Cloacimonadota bacterium]
MKKMRLCKFLPAVILFILLFINPGIHVYLHALFPSDILKTDSPIPRQLIQDETSVIPPTTNPTFDIIVNFFTKIYYQIPPFYREHRASIWIIFLSLLFLIMVISSIHNFYKRKILEKDLKKEYQKIEHRVKERTLKLKLTQEHLQDEIDRLKETERNLKQIKKAIETMKLGVTLSDTTGKIIYTNPANAQMHGYDSEELIGKYTSIFTSNVLREEIDLSKVKEWQGKIRKSSNIRKDGQIFPVQLISDLVRNEKGEIIAIVTTCEDITRRSLDEEALRTSEENYRRIFDNIQDIYYEVNIDGIIQEISPSVITISSYTREELLGKPISDIYANAKQRDNFLKALKKEEKVHDYEILIKGKGDAPPIPCSVTAKLILDESGLPLKIIGSMRNVLARKKAEEKQAQTLKDLQLANKELRDFAYVTSHDLKSP